MAHRHADVAALAAKCVPLLGHSYVAKDTQCMPRTRQAGSRRRRSPRAAARRVRSAPRPPPAPQQPLHTTDATSVCLYHPPAFSAFTDRDSTSKLLCIRLAHKGALHAGLVLRWQTLGKDGDRRRRRGLASQQFSGTCLDHLVRHCLVRHFRGRLFGWDHRRAQRDLGAERRQDVCPCTGQR